MRELDGFSSRLSTFFGRAPTQRNGNNDDWFTQAEWSPLVDISEDDQEYLIKAELPGIERDQVKVSVEDGILIISGERHAEKEEKNKKYHRIERASGSFIRSFALPDDADGTKVNAEFKNGILKVHLPKDENAKPRSIQNKINYGAWGRSPRAECVRPLPQFNKKGVSYDRYANHDCQSSYDRRSRQLEVDCCDPHFCPGDCSGSDQHRIVLSIPGLPSRLGSTSRLGPSAAASRCAESTGPGLNDGL
jgi:HSP20 family protein